MTREIVLDTETTGLSPQGGHRVVEIGCVELVNHLPSGEVYHQYINPERDMPTAAFEIHGLSEEFLRDKPKFSDIADAFRDFVGDATLIIHNASFDMGFLNNEFKLIDAPPMNGPKVIDTLAMAQKKHPGGPNSLDALCRRYHVDNSGRTKHGALLDSELLAEVYLELIGGAQPHLTLVEKTTGSKSQTPLITKARARAKPLSSSLTSDDIDRHRAAVKKLGSDSLWEKYYRQNQ